MTMLEATAADARLTPAAAAWRTLLVHVEPGDYAAARVDAAAALAEELGALLVGVGAETIAPMTFADPYMGPTAELFTALREQIDANLKAAEKTFRSHATCAHREWRVVDNRPTPTLAAMARACDLIVAGGAPTGGADTYRQADTAELALVAGRPVLVVPPAGGRLRAQKIVVAWKDTREARRALADALPLLRSAEEVLVVAVGDEAAASDAKSQTKDVVEGLKRHGVKARAKTVIAPDARAAERLNGEAAAIGADLIVAGCYGRSRLNEWLFGGVTRELLQAPERFALLSH